MSDCDADYDMEDEYRENDDSDCNESANVTTKPRRIDLSNSRSINELSTSQVMNLADAEFEPSRRRGKKRLLKHAEFIGLNTFPQVVEQQPRSLA